MCDWALDNNGQLRNVQYLNPEILRHGLSHWTNYRDNPYITDKPGTISLSLEINTDKKPCCIPSATKPPTFMIASPEFGSHGLGKPVGIAECPKYYGRLSESPFSSPYGSTSWAKILQE